MKTIAIISLYLIGVIQLMLGLVAGRLRIYAVEGPFWGELGLSTADNSRVFQKYIGIIKDQWGIVAWVGLFTIIATTVLAIATRCKPEGRKK